jgi:hypothetical protein
MIDGKTKIYGCRLTDAEAKKLEKAAKAAKLKPARWLRNVAVAALETEIDRRDKPFTPAEIPTVKIPVRVPDAWIGRPVPRTWAQEWSAMESMDPAEAIARFNELRAGRKLPKGFGGWGKTERIAWLNREMPL